MTRTYYAATLAGSEPGAIDNVYSFEYYSQRKQWLADWGEPFGVRVKIVAKIAKKHTPIEVTFEYPVIDGGWVWMYSGIPE